MAVARTLAELVAAVAAEAPTSAAIQAPDRAPLAYAGIRAAMARVRATLREAGIGPRDRVALALPNGPEAAVAFLGVAAAATCAPLNPAFKQSDFAFAYRDLGVRAVLLADGQIAAAEAAARELALPVLRVLPDPTGVAGLFDLQLEGAVRSAPDDAAPVPDDVALVLHTSGTTARPKIVPLTQRNLCVSADNIRRTLALAPGDVCLNVMPLFHIHGLMAALLASLAGGASVVCTTGFRAADFATWLRDLAPTWYTAVPTIHQAVLAACADHAAVRGSRLRLVRSSSASLPPRVLHELAALFAVPVVEAYGMTEAAHQMASNPIMPGAQKPGSVGPPAGPEVAVMDASGRLLARGVVGELVIRGETVTTGYEQNAHANAAAFTDGWFRTGDQGYVDDDGYVYLTGRLKELINRGGEKIAPREVEEALLRHPAVAQAVAFAAPHATLGEEVAAAVVLRAGAHATPRELRETTSAHLAYFKVPRRIEVVAEIPKGATGKVQRATLARTLGLAGGTPAAGGTGGTSEPRGGAPPSELEARIAREWARLLNVATVAVDDDFFALGGDSLAAVEMIDALAELLDVDVPVGDFLEQPTIATIVAHHERASRDELVAIRRDGDEPPVFCVAAHDGRLWGVARLARHLAIDGPVYGFRTPAVDARGPLPTMGELAELNLAALARIQPDGPVRLIGACFGGTVAQEMAVRLERRGRAVELLVMLNSFNRAWRRSDVADASVALRARHVLSRVRLHASRLGARAAGERTAYVAERLRLVRRHWTDEARRLAFELLSRAGLPRPRALRKVAYASRYAQSRHIARPFAGRVLLVHATAPIAGVYPLPRLGWGELLSGDVELLELPCEQLEFWSSDDVLREVADEIAARLAASRGAASSSEEAHLPGAA